MPPGVLASGPKPCGGNKIIIGSLDMRVQTIRNVMGGGTFSACRNLSFFFPFFFFTSAASAEYFYLGEGGGGREGRGQSHAQILFLQGLGRGWEIGGENILQPQSYS